LKSDLYQKGTGLRVELAGVFSVFLSGGKDYGGIKLAGFKVTKKFRKF